MTRKVHRFDPTCCTLAEMADASHAAFEALTPAEKKQYQDECQQWRREQELLAMPIANDWVN